DGEAPGAETPGAEGAGVEVAVPESGQEADVADAQEADAGEADAREQAQDEQPSIPVRAVVVRGNRLIEAQRILEVIQATQVGQPLRVEDVQADLRNIYELGYFE